ncbi:MAG: 5'-nucleotidase C-terminal domain-containing protein [Chloroflexi bacterium]|nr:5'-nucleotidase C-terminal domain-containing protein [Chloroflexota bacterium]
MVSLVLALLIVATGTNAATSLKPRQPVTIQFLTVSDWHAQLDPLSVTGVGNVGGAAELLSYWKADRAANPNSLTITAGDAYGAAPPLSGFFEEESAVKTMNAMGFAVDTFGNHNFDRGVAHLQRMIDLADFQYVSANLKNVEDNLSGVKPFEIFDIGGVKVAVIGVTNQEAPTLVFPGNFGTIEITDPVQAANKARGQAKKAGAQVFVAITHMGIEGADPMTGAPVGRLIDFASGLEDFDVVFGDHTDVQFNTVINGALVVENRSKGLTYSKTNLTVDPKTGTVLNSAVQFVTPLSSAVTPDSSIVNLLAPYRTQLAAAFDTKVGVTTDIFPRGGNVERVREVALGNLVADSMRLRYGTQLAFTNGGGLRAALPSSYAPLDKTLRRPSAGYVAGPPYDLVIGDVFTVLPFGNSVVTRNVTGAQLHAIVEHSVAALPSANGRFAQISGFKFSYDVTRAPGSRVISLTLADGTPIPADATTYTLATNDFTNAGGDGYTMLADGKGTTREVMADVLLDHIRQLGTITPTLEGRITAVTP